MRKTGLIVVVILMFIAPAWAQASHNAGQAAARFFALTSSFVASGSQPS